MIVCFLQQSGTERHTGFPKLLASCMDLCFLLRSQIIPFGENQEGLQNQWYRKQNPVKQVFQNDIALGETTITSISS